MLQDFLAGRPALTSDSRVPAVPAARGGSFQPLAAGRPVELPTAGRASRVADLSETELVDEPQIELVEENGVVQRIIVTCTCCKRIELECGY